MASWQFVYAKRFAFYPPDYDSPGLGGSEAVLVILTRELAARGHDVTVYNCCYRPGRYDGVAWRPLHELPAAPWPDLRVAVRYEESVSDAPAGRELFWMLDNRPEGAVSFEGRPCFREGSVVVASRAMATVAKRGGLRSVPTHIPHPVETWLYPAADTAPRAPTCLYASIAERGLDVLLEIWPRVRAAVPSAKLCVTSGFELWGFTKSESAALSQPIFDIARQTDGVQLLGVLDRDQLRRMQAQSALLVYPCRDEEMFCLSVAEAAAAGTPTVTGDSHALAERVGDGDTGFLIEGCIDEQKTKDQFVDQTVKLLTDRPLRSAMGIRAQQLAQELDARTIAMRWEQLFCSTSADTPGA